MKNLVDLMIEIIKEESEINSEGIKELLDRLENYPHKRKGKLNGVPDCITICFGDKRKEWLLYDQQKLKENDVIECNNERRVVNQVADKWFYKNEFALSKDHYIQVI